MSRTDSKFYNGNEHIFYSDDGNSNVYLKAGDGQTLVIDSAVSSTKVSGGFYISTPTNTSFSGSNVWTKLNGTTTNDTVDTVNITGSNGRLTYSGTVSNCLFFCSYSVSINGTNNEVIQVGVSKNGADPNATSITGVKFNGGGITVCSSSTSHLRLNPGDYIEIYVKNTTSGNQISTPFGSMNIIGGF